MANPGSILGQIGESIEQIGKDVARETVQAPKDLVGTALESLGASSGKKKTSKQAKTAPPQTQGQTEPATPEAAHEEEIKRAVARRALEELSGKAKPKEESVWEKIQKEEEQKKEQKKLQKEQAAKASLPQIASKRKRGDLYGVKAKKSQIENRNVRQD